MRGPSFEEFYAHARPNLLDVVRLGYKELRSKCPDADAEEIEKALVRVLGKLADQAMPSWVKQDIPHAISYGRRSVLRAIGEVMQEASR